MSRHIYKVVARGHPKRDEAQHIVYDYFIKNTHNMIRSTLCADCRTSLTTYAKGQAKKYINKDDYFINFDLSTTEWVKKRLESVIRGRKYDVQKRAISEDTTIKRIRESLFSIERLLTGKECQQIQEHIEIIRAHLQRRETTILITSRQKEESGDFSLTP